MNTEKITLVTGFDALVSPMTGKEQSLLTRSDGKDFGEKLTDMLCSLVKQVGDVDITALTPPERRELFSKMPSCDKQVLLIGIRDVSLPGEETFDFDYKYLDRVTGKEVIAPQSFNLKGGFPTFPMRTYDHEQFQGVKRLAEYREAIAGLPVARFESYADVLKSLDVQVVLPQSGKRIRFTRLNSAGEAIGAAVKKNKRSSHTPLLMRNPVYFVTDKDTPIRFTESDLDALPLMDIEVMRLLMKELDGRVDTEVRFEHPDAEYKPEEEKNVIIDLLSQVTFFFPSGAI